MGNETGALTVAAQKQAAELVRPGRDSYEIAVGPKFEELLSRCEVLLKTGFLPAHLKTKEQAAAVVLIGYELGVPMMQALRKVYVVHGTPGLGGELMLALALRTREVVSHELKTDATGATFGIQRKGWDKPQHFTFTRDDAQKMGLLDKDNYKKQGPTMYGWRAVAKGLRVAFPDAMGGMYLLEEIAPDIQIDNAGRIVGEIPATAPKTVQMPKRKSELPVQDGQQVQPQDPPAPDPVDPPAPAEEPRAPTAAAPADERPADFGKDENGMYVEGRIQKTKAGEKRFGVQIGGDWFGTFDAKLKEALQNAEGYGERIRIYFKTRTHDGKILKDVVEIADAAEKPPEEGA